MSLNPKQQRFVEEYLKDFNATQAAIRAGYSKASAYSQASDLLKNPKVVEELQRLGTKVAEKAEWDAVVILKEIGRLALLDVSQAFNEDGTLKPLSEIPEDIRRCIAGIEYEDLIENRDGDREKVGDLVKVKFWDKTKGLEMAGRYLKLFTDKVIIENLDELAGKLEAARRRRAA